jgi:hypothetical protein
MLSGRLLQLLRNGEFDQRPMLDALDVRQSAYWTSRSLVHRGINHSIGP